MPDNSTESLGHALICWLQANVSDVDINELTEIGIAYEPFSLPSAQDEFAERVSAVYRTGGWGEALFADDVERLGSVGCEFERKTNLTRRDHCSWLYAAAVVVESMDRGIDREDVPDWMRRLLQEATALGCLELDLALLQFLKQLGKRGWIVGLFAPLGVCQLATRIASEGAGAVSIEDVRNEWRYHRHSSAEIRTDLEDSLKQCSVVVNCLNRLVAPQL